MHWGVKVIRVYCHHCGKEIVDLLPFKCRHCNEYYCIDHFLPENHSCPVFNPQPLKNYQIKTINPEEQIPQTPIKSEIKQVSENEEKYIPKTTIQSEKPEKINERSLKLTLSLVIIIILLTITSVVGFLILKQNYSELTDEKHSLDNELLITKDQIVNTNSHLNLSIAQLEKINANLQDNISKINLQKTGDKYSLHDPLFSDVTQFIANDKSSELTLEIVNAKDQGIQCASVAVGIVGSEGNSSGNQYLLIGFNTTDRGMVYFEPETDYQVFPIIGYKYVNCVMGTPYYSTCDDTITSILAIW